MGAQNDFFSFFLTNFFHIRRLSAAFNDLYLNQAAKQVCSTPQGQMYVVQSKRQCTKLCSRIGVYIGVFLLACMYFQLPCYALVRMRKRGIW